MMMRKNKLYVALCLVALALPLLGNAKTKGEAYPEMFEDDEASTILIMPPINLTDDVDVKEYFYYTLNTQLAASGWYVYPPILALRTLQEESAADSELFEEADISKFGEIFGADYLMFPTIYRWDKSTVGKSITVGVRYNLRSTKTGNTVFKRDYTYSYDLSGADKAMAKSVAQNSYTSTNATANLVSSFIQLGALLGTMATTTIATAKQDVMDVARYCNLYALDDLPAGPLSWNRGYDKDNEAGSYIGSYSNN